MWILEILVEATMWFSKGGYLIILCRYAAWWNWFCTSNFQSRTELLSNLLCCLIRLMLLLKISTEETSRCYVTAFISNRKNYILLYFFTVLFALIHISHGFTVHLSWAKFMPLSNIVYLSSFHWHNFLQSSVLALMLLWHCSWTD